MKILALIPARMGSSRFLGKSMIGHVYERVSQNENLSLTAVATCDE
jgi:3-deoxy-manno-octulosonate cytidylyltransferase (CMP-KDO synthetase)